MKSFVRQFIKCVRNRNANMGAAVTSSTQLEQRDFPFLLGILLARLSEVERFLVVQVGANDGVVNDPINKFIKDNPERVAGVFIEPQPNVFSRLEKNYSFLPRKMFLNCVIY